MDDLRDVPGTPTERYMSDLAHANVRMDSAHEHLRILYSAIARGEGKVSPAISDDHLGSIIVDLQVAIKYAEKCLMPKKGDPK